MVERIPVLVVAGFLGSGKTTLLNHLLRYNNGLRIGVVVNDFGSVNIDSMLVAGQVDGVVSLGNGCLCCAVDVSDLDEMFAVLTGPGSPVDAIVVEASGLAEPRNMIRLVLGSENDRLRYGGLVVVVDAAEFEHTSADHPELATHLALADLVVLNKADRVAPEDIEALSNSVRTTAPEVPIVATSRGVVDVGLLFDLPDRGPATVPVQMTLDDLLREDDHDHDTHLHDRFSALTFRAETLDPRAFVAFLENPPVGLYRSKGFVDFGGAGRRFLVHTVGRHIAFEPVRRPGTELVLIGSGTDTGAIESELTAMQRAEPATDAQMLVVHRYVR
ncbi:cobalamin biosynthesis protein CobW [Rhodococcoides trifolii]|uniref:Cobalamin biosynthesis protein CobW n=1 Tax=Rhodococcoides trifolii TaxID=908250 RepID=A0A917D181_9NOCA|nr:CobW family GTP-binding protein [Rhodococcus trifolii]GGG05922.1 cobalamin biosynthesis protein CobW [Rhodococcus trifolii]